MLKMVKPVIPKESDEIVSSNFIELCVSKMQMMWAADFDESLAHDLEENCLEALVVQLPRDSESETRDESVESGSSAMKATLEMNHGNVDCSVTAENGMKSATTRHFCGLTRNIWSRNDPLQICAAVLSTKKGDDELPVFCVAAILIMNHQKIIRETHSIDDMIKAGALILSIWFLTFTK